MRLGKKIFQGIGIVTVFAVVGMAGVHNFWQIANQKGEAEEILVVTAEVESEMSSVVTEAEGEVEIIEEISAVEIKLTQLRLAKERAWSEKIAGWEQVADKEQIATDILQHFREQQLEILIQAKGFSQSVVLITENRVNVLVPEGEAKKGYQMLHDLVTGNLGVASDEVYIIPLTDS